MTTSNDPADIAFALCQVDSTTGQEGPVIALAERMLGARGWQARRIPVSPGRDNLLATSAEAPEICLSTHLDTVPPFIPPAREGDTLTGRGSCDAKGQAAALICAGEILRGRGVKVAVLLVIGEETVHDGARAANREKTTTRVLINGEPTESRLAIGTKGVLRFILRTKGKAAHSAYPHLGHSATLDLVKLLAEMDTLVLPTDAQLGETTINIGRLSGGVAYNVMAPEAEAQLMARLVTPADELVALLQQWVNGRAELEPGVPVPLARLTTLPGFPTSVVAYATDVPNLDAWGTPYLFGPGSIHVAHTDHECIDVGELRAAVDTYVRLAEAALRR